MFRVAGIALVLTFGLAVPGSAGTVQHERRITISDLYLGLTTRGWVGVDLAYGPAPATPPTSVSIAIGARPRVVYGFIGDQVRSPIHSSAPNDSHRRAGVRYRVTVTFCWKQVQRARAAKLACDSQSALTTDATMHHRFPRAP